MQVLQSGRRRQTVQRLTEGVGGDPNAVDRACGQCGVQPTQEPFAAVMVMLPGIFPVQDNRDQQAIARCALRDLADAAQDVLDGRLRGGLGVDEPERVGQVTVRKTIAISSPGGPTVYGW